jgi:hypothetical protein
MWMIAIAIGQPLPRGRLDPPRRAQRDALTCEDRVAVPLAGSVAERTARGRADTKARSVEFGIICSVRSPPKVTDGWQGVFRPGASERRQRAESGHSQARDRTTLPKNC